MKVKKYIGLILILLFGIMGCEAGIGMDAYDSDGTSGGDGEYLSSWAGITTLAQVDGTRNSISWTVPDSHPSGEALEMPRR